MLMKHKRTPGQETERVYTYNPRARIHGAVVPKLKGLLGFLCGGGVRPQLRLLVLIDTAVSKLTRRRFSCERGFPVLYLQRFTAVGRAARSIDPVYNV